MTVELISVGTEILLGNIVNTNAAYLAEKLAMLGLSCYHQSVVGDNEERLEDVYKRQLIEYAKYVNNYYGTPKAYVQEQLHAGKDVILEIEIQGALKVKEKFPETLLLFVTPPTASELKKRLVGRGTESMEVIDQRMLRACEEAEGMDKYDYYRCV